MSVFYKLYQDNRETSNKKGQWYARAAITDTVTTDQLAKIMQRNSTVKISDIKAVLAELAETMQDQLQASRRVKIDGIGAFKLGLTTKPASTAKEFNASKNIAGIHVVFQPETHIDKDRKRTKMLISGASVRELPKNAVDTSNAAGGDAANGAEKN